MLSLATLLAITWEPEIRGILVVLIGVVVLMRQRLPAARHQPRRPPRLPGRAGRPVRLADAHGHRLVSLRHRPRRARTRPGSVKDVIGTELSELGVTDRGPGRRTSVQATPDGAGRRLDPHLAEDNAGVRPGGRPRPTTSSRTRPRPSRPATTSRSRSTRQGRRARTRRSATLRLLRLLPPAALRHRPGAAGRPDSRPSPGRAPPPAGRPDEASRHATCSWSATSAPSAAGRLADASAPGCMFVLLLLHAAPARRSLRTNLAAAASDGARRPGERVGLSGGPRRWASTSPIVAAARARPCCSPRISFIDVQAARPAGGPTRPSRRRTSAASCRAEEPPRALPGALLPGRDDLHHLRHRDHLPLPVRRDRDRRSARSGSGRSSCSAWSSSSRSCT